MKDKYIEPISFLLTLNRKWKDRYNTAYIRRFHELVKEKMTYEAMIAYKIEHGHAGLAIELMKQARSETNKWTREDVDAYLKTHKETLSERVERLGLDFIAELKKEYEHDRLSKKQFAKKKL